MQATKNVTEIQQPSERICAIIDLFENFLYEKGVSITNDERLEEDENGTLREPENAAIIYGSDYYALYDKVEAILGRK